MTPALYTLTESQWAFMAHLGWKEGRAREATNSFNTTLLLYALDHLGPAEGKTLEQTERTQNLDAIIKVLIEQGADVNAMDHFGHSVLGEAGHHGTQGITLLLDAGADPNQREPWHPHNTVAMTCLKNHIDGAANRSPEPKGMFATIGQGLGQLRDQEKASSKQGESLDMALRLVAAGADPDATNNEGQKLGDFFTPPKDLVLEMAKRTADRLDGILPKAAAPVSIPSTRRL